MVRALDLPLVSEFNDFDDDHGVFGMSDISQSPDSTWSDETPPDTPRYGSPTVFLEKNVILTSKLFSLSECAHLSTSKNGERIDLWEVDERLAGKTKSPSSIMWNVDTVPDPACKLVPSTVQVAPCEYLKSPVSFDFELFALADVSSGDFLNLLCHYMQCLVCFLETNLTPISCPCINV